MADWEATMVIQAFITGTATTTTIIMELGTLTDTAAIAETISKSIFKKGLALKYKRARPFFNFGKVEMSGNVKKKFRILFKRKKYKENESHIERRN